MSNDMKHQQSINDEWLRERVDEALNDPRPSVLAREVFRRLREYRVAIALDTLSHRWRPTSKKPRSSV